MTDKKPPKAPNTGYAGWGPAFRQWLTGYLPEGKTILELGSGVGTRWLCRRWNVISVEHDREWLGVAGKATYFHAPITHGWYNRVAVHYAALNPYDLIIIDGPPGTIGRAGILQNMDLFDWTRPMVVDDTNRPAEMALAKEIARRTGRSRVVYPDALKQFTVI